jgi:hypothetical protein
LETHERANALFGGLSAEDQAATKRLFVSLVTPGEGREDTRARIDMPGDEAVRRVVQTFAGGEARLVVTDEAGGRRSVEVSHEALIRHWEKLRGWIDENRDILRTREFLRANRAEWVKHDHDPTLLELPDLHLAAAQELYEQPGDVVIDDIKDYIEALLKRKRQWEEEKRLELEAKQHEALERANERAEAAQRIAEERARSEESERRLRHQAEESANEARQQAKLASEQKAASIRNESAALTALSNASRPSNSALAAKLALAAWPRNCDGPGPKLDVTFEALAAAVAELRERKVLRGHDGPVQSAAFSPDGACIVTTSNDKTARIWDVDGQGECRPARP